MNRDKLTAKIRKAIIDRIAADKAGDNLAARKANAAHHLATRYRNQIDAAAREQAHSFNAAAAQACAFGWL